MRSYLEELRTAVSCCKPDTDWSDGMQQIACFFKETEAMSGCKAPIVDKVLVQALSCSRLLQIDDSGKIGKTNEKFEDFLQAWFDGLVRHTTGGLPGLVREKAGLTQQSDLFDLLAASMLLMLKNAEDDWDTLYIRPLKEKLREKIQVLPSVSLPWKQADVDTVPAQALKDSFYALPEIAPLRQATGYEEMLLRRLLCQINNAMFNGYLSLGRKYIHDRLPEKIQKDFKQGSYTLQEMLPPVAQALRADKISALLYNGKTAVITENGRSPSKVQQRILRYLLFALLSGRERMYGTLWDHRELLLQLAFALELDGSGVDRLLREQDLPGLDYKNGYETLFAYAADHFPAQRFAHAKALQKLYELGAGGQRTERQTPQYTAICRRRYSADTLCERTPAAFLDHCAAMGLPPLRGDKQGGGQEAPRRVQGMELRRIMAGLEAIVQKDPDRYAQMRLAYESTLLCIDYGLEPTPDTPGWIRFWSWGTTVGKTRKGFRRSEVVCLSEWGSAEKENQDADYDVQNAIEAWGRDAMRCIRTGEILDRSTFIKLLYLEYKLAAPLNGRTLPNEPEKRFRAFAKDTEVILQRCRMLPCIADTDALRIALHRIL